MREVTETLLSALQRDEGGVAIVWCPDLGLRDWIVSEVESLASPSARPFRTASVEEAIAEPERLSLLIPNDEKATVLDLDGSRDRLRGESHGRSQPIVLFLLRGGDGQRALAEHAPSLSSWAGGSDVDPEELAQIDPAAEREEFLERTGATPEAWLVPWRAGATARDGETYALAYWAALLEKA